MTALSLFGRQKNSWKMFHQDIISKDTYFFTCIFTCVKSRKTSDIVDSLAEFSGEVWWISEFKTYNGKTKVTFRN